MLSIGVMANGQGDYYVALASPDYYLSGGEPLGRWCSQGAHELGLAGTVESDHFANLLSGHTPTGNARLVQNAGERDRRPGWDLTFSAPKSVSTLWSQADPLIRRIIEDAHRQAVESAIAYLEAHAAYTRRGRGGFIREPVHLVVAQFRHHTSRQGEPQLHDHLITLNIGVRHDGTVGAIESRPFFRAKMAAGALYRAELAYQLQRQLGISIIRNGALFEVEGVPAELIARFSSRRHAIEEHLAAQGLTGAKASAVAALATRPAKEQAALDTLLREWQSVGPAYGFGPEQLRAVLNRATIGADVQPLADQALAEALKRITHQNSHFSHADLIRRVAEEAAGQGFGADVVRARVTLYLRSKDAVVIGPKDNEVRYTTLEMVKLESRLLTVAGQLRNGAFPGLSTTTLNEVYAEHPGLNDEQRAAIAHVGTQGGCHLVQGLAGTGKTTMLAAVHAAFQREGYSVFGAAVSAKAARGLEQGSGIPSGTVHALLNHFGASRTQTPVPDRGGHESAVPGRSVLVVDEAAMVGTRQMLQLFEHCAAAGVHIVLIGDHKQLQPIEAGGPFVALTREFGQAEMTTIVRQRDAWARNAVSAMADGHAASVLGEFAARGQLRIAEDQEQAMCELVSDWYRAGAEHPHDHLIVASTLREVRALNWMCQLTRLENGDLGSRYLAAPHAVFYEGDRVLFTRNDRLLGVLNGSIGAVVRIDPARQTLSVQLDTGRTITITAPALEHLQLSYALTTFKSQGHTAHFAYVLVAGDMLDREVAYVQVSRAKFETRLYGDAAQAGPDLVDLIRQMTTSHKKELALDVMDQSRRQELEGSLSLGYGAMV